MSESTKIDDRIQALEDRLENLQKEIEGFDSGSGHAPKSWWLKSLDYRKADIMLQASPISTDFYKLVSREEGLLSEVAMLNGRKEANADLAAMRGIGDRTARQSMIMMFLTIAIGLLTVVNVGATIKSLKASAELLAPLESMQTELRSQGWTLDRIRSNTSD